MHGTTITLLNAARRYLGKDADDGLGGVLYVSSGLGGMSGAQAKAAVISGAVAIIAECNEFAAKKRFEQGWLSELHYELQTVIDSAEQAKAVLRVMDLLDDNDDVQDVYANFDIPVEVLEALDT